MYKYEMADNVAVLTMENGENRFSDASLNAFGKILDEIEFNTEANALVVKSAHEKIWCNGLDLDWLLPEIHAKGDKFLYPFLGRVYTLLKRMLTFPMPTVAEINGHAFGGGVFLAFAHDMRFMRSDRGWMCFPEVDLKMTFSPGFMIMAKRVLPLPLLEEMQYTARRMTATECLENRIINRACSLETLHDEAVAYAQGLNKSRDVIRDMKLETHEQLLKDLDRAIAAVGEKRK